MLVGGNRLGRVRAAHCTLRCVQMNAGGSQQSTSEMVSLRPGCVSCACLPSHLQLAVLACDHLATDILLDQGPSESLMVSVRHHGMAGLPTRILADVMVQLATVSYTHLTLPTKRIV